MNPNARDNLNAVLQDVTAANGLPNAHYTSGACFAQERDALWFDQWAALAFTSDVPEPGDVKPMDFLGLPLLLVHDHDGEIRVFQNTCRHRGMILVDKPGKVDRAITCPYHAWCYRLDGRLTATPHAGGVGKHHHPALARDSLSLVSFPAQVWHGVIFVNINANAPSFERWAAPLIERWQDFEQPHIPGNSEDSQFSMSVKTNWKLAVENYCESYHLPWVHPELNRNSALEDHYNISLPGHASGQGSSLYRRIRAQDNSTIPEFAGLSEFWQEGAEYMALYPNVLLGVHCDHSFAMILLPQGLEQTLERVAIFYAHEEVAQGEDYAGLRRDNSARWREVFLEDVSVVEGMQRGRHGLYFDGGRFSPVMDTATHCFHQWAADALLKREFMAESADVPVERSSQLPEVPSGA